MEESPPVYYMLGLESNTTTNNTIPTLAPFNYFGFTPNKGVEFAVLALYVVISITLIVMNVKRKTMFMMPLVYGGFIEIIAFAARIYTTYHTGSKVGYIVYLVPVIVAPTVLAAADYSLAGPVMTKGRVRVCCCTPTVSKYSFLVCDIAAFIIQAFGASLVGTATSEKTIKNGSNIILGGLAISLSVFVIFMFYSMTLHRRILAKERKNGKDDEHPNWTRIFWVIYFNMLMLTIRSCYRVAEFESHDPHGPLSVNEGYFYGLDTFLMVLLMLSWVIFHPSFFGVKAQKDQDTIPMNKVNGY